jgi:hypothetical protein
LRVPYPKADQVIAKALRVHPADIWPSRYDRNELVSNPRLWRRWINVKGTTGESPADVNHTPAN